MTLAATWHELESERARIVEAQERIKAALVDELGVGRHDAGASVVTVSPPTRRFDPELARRVLDPQQLTMCSTVVVDAARARAVLPPDVYASCQQAKPGAAPVVRIA